MTSGDLNTLPGNVVPNQNCIDSGTNLLAEWPTSYADAHHDQDADPILEFDDIDIIFHAIILPEDDSEVGPEQQDEFDIPLPVIPLDRLIPKQFHTGQELNKRGTVQEVCAKDIIIFNWLKYNLVVRQGQYLVLQPIIDRLNQFLGKQNLGNADCGRVRGLLEVVLGLLPRHNICRRCQVRATKLSCGDHYIPQRRTKWFVVPDAGLR